MFRPFVARARLAVALLIFVGCMGLTGCFETTLDIASHSYYVCRSRFGRDLYILVIYDGFFAREGTVDDATRRLSDFISKGDEVFLPICILGEWGTVSISEMKKDLVSPEKTDKGKHPAVFKYQEFVVDNMGVRLGGLYRDKETGRLCGYQVIRIKKVKTFVSLANSALGEWALDDVLPDIRRGSDGPFPFPQSAALWTDLWKKGEHKWFDLNGSSLEINLPVAPSEAEGMRKKALEEGFIPWLWSIQSGEEKLSTDTLKHCAEFFSCNPFSLMQKANGFQFVIGYPDEKMNRLIFPFNTENSAPYTDNLVPWAFSQQCWKGDLDVKEIVRGFENNPSRLF